MLEEVETFGVMGATILENFGLKMNPDLIGKPIAEIFE